MTNEPEDRRNAPKLLESPEFWQAFAHCVPDMLILVDASARILYINRTPEGLSPGDVLGSSALQFVPEATRADLICSLSGIFAGASARERDQCAVLPDGSTRWYAMRTGPVVVNNRTVAAIIVARDITERRRLEAQVIEWQKMDAIGNLAAGIAHDFNNLLTIVSASAHLIAQHATSPIVVADAEAILAEVERGSALATQLMSYAKRQPPPAGQVNLNDVVRDMARAVRRVMHDGITVEEELDDEDVFVKMHRSQVEQVFMNLVLNARDAIDDTGTITVTTKACERNNAHLIVADDGCGIDADIRKRVFEPFFTTKGSRGSGLGLSTVQAIAHRAGGQIEITSEAGVGTTCDVSLPCSVPVPHARKSHMAVQF